MPTDPRKLRPSELCRLLNSTPLGEVITDASLHRHRTRAGLRIGEGRRVDLIRYVAWLVQTRHAPKSERANTAIRETDLEEAAQGAAAAASRNDRLKGHGQKLSLKQEALIAALLTESTNTAAAAKAGISQATLYRWLNREDFRAAYRHARRELVESAIGRIQTASAQAVDTLVAVARQGRRDSDRVRAAVSLLDHALRGLERADLLEGDYGASDASSINTGDVVNILAARLRQIDAAGLPTAEKSRLTATVADTLLRAIGVDVLDKRLESLQAILLDRKEKHAKKT